MNVSIIIEKGQSVGNILQYEIHVKLWKPVNKYQTKTSFKQINLNRLTKFSHVDHK